MPKSIKLRLNGRTVHLVPMREVQRWTGFVNAADAARELLTPTTVADIRSSLMMPRTTTEKVYVQLTKELEDGGAFFFEVPREQPMFDPVPEFDLFDLLPNGTDDDDNDARNRGQGGDAHRDRGLRWISITCVSPSGRSFAGASVRFRAHGNGFEYGTLNSQSCLHLADLTEGGTVQFELSADARPGSYLRPPEGAQYELGAPVGLATGREHLLVVHPNPRALVTASLVIGGESVTTGAYTLSTPAGTTRGQHDGAPARNEGALVPTAATYSFNGVALPIPKRIPRAADEAADGESGSADGSDDARDHIDDENTDGRKHTSTDESARSLSVGVGVAGGSGGSGTPVPATLIESDGTERALLGRLELRATTSGRVKVAFRRLALPLPEPTPRN